MTDSPLARYLVPLRRWWPILLGAVALAMVMTWVTMPESSESDDEVAAGTFEATHLLARAGDSAVTANLDVVTVVVRDGPIRAEVAEQLGDQVAPGWPDSLVVVPDHRLGTLAITVSQPTPEQAVLLASTYADAVIDHYDGRALAMEETQIARITQRLTEIDQRIRELESQLEGLEEGTADASAAESERNVYLNQSAELQIQLRDLYSRSGAAQSTFTTLQTPVAVAAEDTAETAFALPQTPWVRFLLAALASLIVGMAIILGVDWLDTRVRSRGDAEEAFGLPVIAEFPRRTRGDLRTNPIPVHSDPGGITAETFRALRLSVLRGSRWRLERVRATVGGDGPVGTATQVTGDQDPRVILVSSARDGEGKSTVTANLAVSIAETGKSVLLIDTDFRRPAVGSLIGVPPGPGLRELTELNSQELARSIVFTELPNLAMLRSGSAGTSPAWFLSESAWIIEQARELADVVLIDTGPLLATNEAATLIPSVDALILVNRSGRIARSQAHRATEQLARLGATVSGVVLVGVDRTMRYGYYEPIRKAAAMGETLRP
jgi:capsular exopolysaccharide synthesis family protein